MISSQDTLCWTCLNAVPDLEGTRGCSWSEELRPVDGWTVKKTKARYGATGYLVLGCPEYKFDEISCRMRGTKKCKNVHMDCDNCPFKKESVDERRVCKTTQEHSG